MSTVQTTRAYYWVYWMDSLIFNEEDAVFSLIDHCRTGSHNIFPFDPGTTVVRDMSASVYIGQRRSFDGASCTVRYVGKVQGTTGEWLGVEWDDPARGKHSGEHGGVRYFTCIYSFFFFI